MSEGFRCGFVSLVGRTNVGKSTLLNRLVGEKVAIVTARSQTTRNRILAVRTDEDAQFVFVDTPGFHRPRHRLNRSMMETAMSALEGVEVLLLVIDAESGIGPGDRWAHRLVAERGGAAAVVVVLTKMDLIKKSRALPLTRQIVEEWGIAEVVPVSGLLGDNCDELLRTVRVLLPEGPPLFPGNYLTDQPERTLAGEIVREKLMERTRDELPHATAVRVDRWAERPDGLVEVEATILVERPGQKAIVIGHGGGMLREVGTAARLELEKRLGTRFFLRLFVQVRQGWRDRPATLRDLGFDVPS